MSLEFASGSPRTSERPVLQRNPNNDSSFRIHGGAEYPFCDSDGHFFVYEIAGLR